MTNTSAHPPVRMPFAGSALVNALAENWWLLLLRGIAAIVFGLLAFFWPGITLLTLTLVWGAYALADGIISLWAATFGHRGDMAPRWWLAVVGIAGVLSGLIAFFWPGITAFALLLFIAGWAIVVGVLEILGAIQLRKEMGGEWLLALTGLASVAFGILLTTRPGVGALAIAWIIGWYALVAGCLWIGLAFRLKAMHT